MSKFLKRRLAALLLLVLLAITFSDKGVCQEYGYGEKPDQWASYQSGRYFERLQKIARIYRFPGGEITYLHFELSYAGIGPVELFRLSSGRECTGDSCNIFVLFAADLDAPLVTPCQFKQAALIHLFNPDNSKFFGFEFSCADTLLRVKVTSTHFMAIPLKKDAEIPEGK